MSNRYPGPCAGCGKRVPARAGTLKKEAGRWAVRHAECAGASDPGYFPRPSRRVIEIRTSGGTFYRNAAGRCEDAPCCGCCTC